MRDNHTFKQHKLDYGETLVQISDHPLCDIAKVVIKDGNKLLNLIKCFVTFNKKTVQLKIDTKAGVANVTDGKDGDFTGIPWKIIRSFQMGSVREDVVDQALNFIQSLVKPMAESRKKSEDASSVDDLLARHNQKWLVKVSYDVDASHSAVAPSIVRADTKDAATNIALKRHRGLGYNMKVVSVDPIEESDKGVKEAIELLESVGYVCERYRGDDYVSDHLMSIEVPGLVHSCIAGTDHSFDSEDEEDYEAQMTIYSDRGRKTFRVWCRVEPMKEPLSEKGELPEFFWKASSYKDGELSRVSRWIKRKIETLRQNCLWRVKQLGDLA